MEAFRSSPRQADLLIVSGRVSHKMAAPLRQIYDQMLEPKWVIAMGACASSGGMFNNYTILQGVDKIVAVDIYVPGCPPRPEALMEGIIRLHEAVQAGVPPAYELRRSRRDADGWDAVPGPRLGEGGARRDDAVVEPATRSSRRARTCATSRASTSSPTSPRPTTSAGAAAASPATSAPPAGRDLNAPMTQGFQALPEPKPKRFSINYHLLALCASAPRRVRVQTWLDDGEPVPSVVERVADRRLARARGLGPDGHPHRRPPEPEAHPHGRRLGRPPAAQGLPARRRARPLLGGRVMAIAPERTRRAPIYEGTRIPQPMPDALRVSDELAATDDVMTVNFGPNHPSTHGVLRLIVDLHGEDVVGLEAVDRLPAHRLREEHGAEDVVEGDHVPGAHRLRLVPEQRARLRARDRAAARARDAAEGRRGCARCSAS